MKRALWFTLVLTGCRLEVPLEKQFACTQDTECASGWYCGPDLHCHAPAEARGGPCFNDGGCPFGLHCGGANTCYERSDAGAVSCRRDGGVKPGGDCADDWRCGLDGVCHPAADAGAIACRFGDDSECTSGWRCGFSGVCLNPAGEALSLPPNRPALGFTLGSNRFDGFTVLELSRVGGGFGQSALVLDRDGRRRVLIRGQGMEGVPGVVNRDPPDASVGHYALHPEGFFQLRAGGQFIDWHGFDGGVHASRAVPRTNCPNWNASTPLTLLEVRAAGESPHALVHGPSSNPNQSDECQVVVPFQVEQFGPFAKDGGVQPGGIHHEGGLQPVQSFALERSTANTGCAVQVMRRPPSAQGEVELAMFLLDYWLNESPPASPNRPSSVPIRLFDGSGARFGVSNVGATHEVRQRNGQPQSSLTLFDLQAASAVCRIEDNAVVFAGTCDNVCGSNGRLLDFVPWRSGASPAVDVACDGALGQYWRRAVVTNRVCAVSDLRSSSGRFSLPLQPSVQVSDAGVPFFPSTVAQSGLSRWARQPGTLRPLMYGGANIEQASAWFLDRTPNFILDGVGSSATALMGTSAMQGREFAGEVLTAPQRGLEEARAHFIPGAGFVFVNPIGVVSELDLDAGAGVTVPRARFEGFGPADVDALQARILPRGSGRELVAAKGEKLYATSWPQLSGPAQPLVVAPVLTLTAGLDIIGFAPRPLEPDAGTTVLELWSATSNDVFRVSRTASGAWRPTALGLELDDAPAGVWSEQDGRARVGTRSGAVYSLPSALKLAEPPSALAGRVNGFFHGCGETLLLDDAQVWRLEAAAPPGKGEWKSVIDGGTGTQAFAGGKAYFTATRVWVVDRYGRSWTAPAQCP